MQHFSYIELGWKTEKILFCCLPSTGISFRKCRSSFLVYGTYGTPFECIYQWVFMYNQGEKPLFWHYKHLNMLRKSFLRVCHKQELRSLTSFLVWHWLSMHLMRATFTMERAFPAAPSLGCVWSLCACHLSLHCSCYLSPSFENCGNNTLSWRHTSSNSTAESSFGMSEWHGSVNPWLADRSNLDQLRIRQPETQFILHPPN